MIKLVVVVFFKVSSELFFKKAVDRLRFDQGRSWAGSLFKTVNKGVFFVGVVLAVAYVFCWADVLKSVDLSYAYPFISIGYALVILAGHFIFGEVLDRYKVIGVSFIIAGTTFLMVG